MGNTKHKRKGLSVCMNISSLKLLPSIHEISHDRCAFRSDPKLRHLLFISYY